MREINPIGLRVPPEVGALVRRAATENGRSLNSQLLVYVQQGLRLDGFTIPRPKKQRPTGGNRQGVSVVKTQLPEGNPHGEVYTYHGKS